MADNVTYVNGDNATYVDGDDAVYIGYTKVIVNGQIYLARNDLKTIVGGGVYAHGETIAVAGDTNVPTNLETLTLTELTASIALDVEVSANTEALTLTEVQASIALDVGVDAATETLVLTELPATVDVSGTNEVLASTAVLTLTELSAVITRDIEVGAATATLALTEYPATIGYQSGDVEVGTNLETLVLTEQQATVSLDVEVSTGTATLTLVENTTDVALGVNVQASTANLSLVENTATLTHNRDTQAGSVTLTLTTHTASVVGGVQIDRDDILKVGQGELVFYDSGWDKKGVQNVEFFFEVSDGAVGRHWHDVIDTTVTLPTGTGEITLWPLAASGQDYVFPTQAQQLAIVSSSASDALLGSAARIVKILGLDANWDPIEEEIDMNGSTVVYTTKDFLRVNNVLVVYAGIDSVAAGNISVLTTNEAVDYEVGYIPAGYGVSLTSAYSIPRNHRYHVKEYFFGYHSKDAGTAEFWYEYTHNPSQVTQPGRRVFVSDEHPNYHSTNALTRPLAGPGDVVMKVNVTSAGSIPVNAAADGVLVEHFQKLAS